MPHGYLSSITSIRFARSSKSCRDLLLINRDMTRTRRDKQAFVKTRERDRPSTRTQKFDHLASAWCVRLAPGIAAPSLLDDLIRLRKQARGDHDAKRFCNGLIDHEFKPG